MGVGRSEFIPTRNAASPTLNKCQHFKSRTVANSVSEIEMWQLFLPWNSYLGILILELIPEQNHHDSYSIIVIC